MEGVCLGADGQTETESVVMYSSWGAAVLEEECGRNKQNVPAVTNLHVELDQEKLRMVLRDTVRTSRDDQVLCRNTGSCVVFDAQRS